MTEETAAVPAHDVSLRWTDATTAEVVVQVRCEDCDRDDAQALSRAWTAIAQAISARKAQDHADAGQAQPAECEQAETPPGTGAWWNG